MQEERMRPAQKKKQKQGEGAQKIAFKTNIPDMPEARLQT